MSNVGLGEEVSQSSPLARCPPVLPILVAAFAVWLRLNAPPSANPIVADAPAPRVVSSAIASAVVPVAPAVAAPPKIEPPKAEPTPATVESLKVPGDHPASIVRGAEGTLLRTVFVPGLCSNANAYLQGFPEAARKHGGVIAIDGDQPCAPGFRSFSWDAAKLDARLEAALAAAEIEPSGKEGLTLVGYSQGAALAEQLVQRWPARYTRFVLIGAPTDPGAAHFAKARGVVTMSCSRDVPARMKDAARRMNGAAIPAAYFEMPGCTHGNIAEGDRVLGDALAWLDTNARE